MLSVSFNSAKEHKIKKHSSNSEDCSISHIFPLVVGETFVLGATWLSRSKEIPGSPDGAVRLFRRERGRAPFQGKSSPRK
jgi:hypothetical protein